MTTRSLTTRASRAGTLLIGLALLAGCGSQPESSADPTRASAAVTFTGSPIVGVASQRCVDINGLSTTNGTQAQLWDCNGGTNQSWTYDASQNLVVYGNKCLQASNGGTSAGTAVVIGDCTGQAGQHWNVNADGTITNVQSGLCMDANGAATANGTKVIIWTCSGASNQKWTVSGAVTSYALNVTKAGTGAGTVTSTPAGIGCGGTCSANYAPATSVTLTAVASSGSSFGGWGGACSGASTTCTVSMGAPQSVTATFNLDQNQGTTVAINAGGAAAGTFLSDVDFSGGSTYSTSSAIDTALISGTAPPQAVLQSERYGEFTYTVPNLGAGNTYTVTLYFAEIYWTAAGQRTFNVVINGGTVLSAFDIFATAGAANRAIARTFDATADANGQIAIQFTRGGGADNPKVSGLAIAPRGPTPTHTLSITTTAGGSTNPAPGTYTFAAGSAVTVTAMAAAGYAFTGWSGAATGITNPVTVTMDADKALTAGFTGTSTPGGPRQAYDGARGTSFDDGWKFNRGDASGAQQTSFNDSAWRSLSVPHDWSVELPFNQSSAAGAGGGYLDGGVGWYRKTFTLDASYAGKRILVGFDGVYMNSQVWINGTSLGTRPYGYSTFQYDITPYVRTDGTNNVIAVRVNNNQPNSRWYSGSGIYRNVWLTTLNPVHVAYNGVFVTTPSVSASSGSVSIATDVQNQSSSSQTVTVRTGIYDANGTLVTSATSAAVGVAANGGSTVNQSLTVSSPRLWSPDVPNLYQVKVEVQVGGATVDTYLSPLGFRWFSFSPTAGMSFNGQYLKMRGTCNHHDLGALGAAFSTRAMERQLQILKAMGVNALRTSHNPPAPELLDLADRLGFVVMDEAFDCWESGKTSNDYHLYFGQWAQTDIQDLARRDRNHPSVIMWSIGNEIPNPTVATATNLRNWVRAVDPTRPVTWNNMDVGGTVASQVASLLDLQGYSYNSWQYDSGHSAHPDWKIFGSESSSAVRSRGVYKTPTNQNILTGSDNQCSSYDNSVVSWGASAENAYKDDNNRTWILGEFIWTGFDYIGEPTPYGWPAKSSYFGICDSAGFPKDVYYFYQSRWTTAPMVHILPHWNWSVGTTVPVWAYSNCDTVELFLNGVSQGSRSLTSSTMHVEWNVPWASGTLRADCRRGGNVVASDTVRTAGSPAQIRLTADRTTIAGDGRDLVYVTADILDASGVFVPTATSSVTFAVSGPGTIVGVDNGNAIDTTSYKSLTRNAFSGKVLAIVRSTGGPGQITVTATSSNLTRGSVSTTAQ